MQPNDLVTAKINATLRILEWARGDVEPGISGTPSKMHIALAEAFREIYAIVDEAIQAKPDAAPGGANEAAAIPIGRDRVGPGEQTP